MHRFHRIDRTSVDRGDRANSEVFDQKEGFRTCHLCSIQEVAVFHRTTSRRGVHTVNCSSILPQHRCRYTNTHPSQHPSLFWILPDPDLVTSIVAIENVKLSNTYYLLNHEFLKICTFYSTISLNLVRIRIRNLKLRTARSGSRRLINYGSTSSGILLPADNDNMDICLWRQTFAFLPQVGGGGVA
jgi:hypothetical protein